MNKKRTVYLDNAATTPVDTAVFKKMQPYFCQKYGNPSSVHQLGQEARQAVEKARQQIADFLSCSAEEVYFTGSASASNNWLIQGLIEKIRSESSIRPHIIISVIEHKAVLEPCQALAAKKLAEVTYLPVNQDGLIEVENLKKAIKKNTRLVSIMYVNNEIGSIQPIEQIGHLIKEVNKRRKQPPHRSKLGAGQAIIFHTDAVQAVNYLDCQVDKLGLDSLSLSGHKIYGPKGIGALYIKKGALINPFIRGGGQERGLMAGTENVAGIVGLGEAIKKIKNQGAKVKKLRDKLITGVLRDISHSQLNGSLKYRLPNNAHFSFKGTEGEGLVIDLSQKGVFASTASACASHSLKPSHVLLALGLLPEQAHSSVRFSLGRQTTVQDIDYVLKVLPKVVARLRKISGRG